MRLLPSLAVLLIAAAPASVGAALPRDLPVRTAGTRGDGGPAWAGDVIEIRLAPAAARRARPATGFRAARLELAGPDRVARELGATFEPEFKGETAPAEGSGEVDFTAFHLVHLPPGTRLEDALARFAALPEVAATSPIAILPVGAVPDDSLWSVSTWFFQPSRRDLHAPEAWEITTGDTGVVVAILDSGVLPYHPDLGGRVAGDPGQIWTNWRERGGVPNFDDDGDGNKDDAHGWDFVDLPSSGWVEPGEDWQSPDPDPNDFAAHGTACAGIIGALTDNGIGVAGTAWRVRIMPLRVGYAFAGASLGEADVRMDWVAQAVRYANRHGAQVINCSFETLDTDGLGAAITEAIRAGVTVVNSAGNFQTINTYLGGRDDVISVAATDANDVVAAFSNTGPYIEIAAPGVGIATTWLAAHAAGDSVAQRQGTYAAHNGTSFAAPLVSGAAALLQARRLQQGRDPLHPMAVLLRLEETADDISALNPGSLGYGSGRLNLDRALTETNGSTAIRIGGASRGAIVPVSPGVGHNRFAFASVDRSIVWLDPTTLDTTFVATIGGTPTRGLALATTTGNVGLFIGSTNGFVYGLHWSGVPLTGWPQGGGAAKWGGPAIGDVDADGEPDVVIGADDGNVYAWSFAGVPLTGFPAAAVNTRIRAPVALADLDGAPGVEIVAVGEDGAVVALGGDGAILPGWESIALGDTPLAPVVGRLGLIGGTAVFVAVGSTLHAFAPDGSVVAGFPVTLAGSILDGVDPAIADLDMDGGEDVVVPTSAGIEARDSSGVSLPGFPHALTGAIGSLVIGHLRPGGGPEILVPTPAGLVALDAAGATVAGFPKPGRAGASPTIADFFVDDLNTEVIAGSGADPGAFFVYDAGSYDGRPHPWATTRGNFERTGSTLQPAIVPVLDTDAPAAVLDLAASRIDGSRVMLRWTAPGDDGRYGRALAYDLRRAARPIAPAEFGGLESVPVGFSPSLGGAPESLEVALPEGAAAWFALLATDDVGNAGPMSNVAAIGVPAPGGAIALAPRRNPARPPALFDWRAPAGGPPPTLSVHDALGRLVRRVDLSTTGEGVAEWDGRDLHGRAVSAGLYFVRLSSAGSVARTRLVLLP